MEFRVKDIHCTEKPIGVRLHYEIMNTSGHDSMNRPRVEFTSYIYILF